MHWIQTSILKNHGQFSINLNFLKEYYYIHRTSSPLSQKYSSTILQLFWKWLGHVLRMPSDKNPKIVLTWALEGKPRRGMSVEQDMVENGKQREGTS